MYNLHTHSLLSDGVLLPSEIAVRYLAAGYKIIAITDHTDYSNIDFNIKALRDFIQHWPKNSPIKILSGVELTHIPPQHFAALAKYARKNGVSIIIGHGETTMEPVAQGTNRAALESDIDILAHPGIISEADVKLTKKRGIFLEITSRKGHANSNRHVARMAKKYGARLILNHDSHKPEDIISPAALKKVGLKAGLTQADLNGMYIDIGKFLRTLLIIFSFVGGLFNLSFAGDDSQSYYVSPYYSPAYTSSNNYIISSAINNAMQTYYQANTFKSSFQDPLPQLPRYYVPSLPSQISPLSFSQQAFSTLDQQKILQKFSESSLPSFSEDLPEEPTYVPDIDKK